MELVMEKVLERDVDLLILEEFSCNPAFAELFLQPADVLQQVRVLYAEHSRTDSDLGESDIYLLTEDEQGRKLGIFIENKVNAIAMPRQCERYELRAERMKAAAEFEDYRIFITAPQKYLEVNGEAGKYAHKVSYEQLAAFFSGQKNFRSEYKCQLLRAAIAQQKKGYTQIKHEVVTDFWKQLAEYLQRNYPKLPPLKGVESKGAQSLWPEFPIVRGVKVVWKSDKGFVDIEFAGKACEINALHAKVEQWCGHGCQLERTGGSAVMRRKVETVAFTQSFAEQQKQIEEACAAIWEQFFLAAEKMDLFSIMNG